MFSPHTFNITEAHYAKQADANLLVIVQIESRMGVEHVESIAQVDGIDVLFVGTCGFTILGNSSERDVKRGQRRLL